MTVLKPVLNGIYQSSEAASIASLADALFAEYGLLGYSLVPEDICTALINDMRFYAGWEATEQQDLGKTIKLDENYPVALHEWAVLEPVIRAHCDFIHAQRMESAGSQGMERFGLSASEASQSYQNAKLEMKKEAFVEQPFTFDFDVK